MRQSKLQVKNNRTGDSKVNIINPLHQSCKVMMFCENEQFSMDIDKNKNQIKSQSNLSSNQLMRRTQKINFVKGSLVFSKKRSISISNNDKNKDNQFQLQFFDNQIKSQHSFLVQSNQIQKPQKQLSQQIRLNISDKQPPQQQLQSYFAKKIRILQSKFKKFKLDSQTQIMKLKNQNKNLKSQINKLKQQLYPNKQQSLKLQNQIKDIYSNDSSSESQINQQKVIPVISQIMQVKIQGKSLCDKIKTLQKAFKLQKSTNLKMKQKIQKLNIDNGYKGQLNRKWSIQELIRHKKQSIQPSKISTDTKQGKGQSCVGQIKKCKKCKKCQQLKSYLLKLNQALRKIQIK